jgi:hypothetical protein
LHVGGELIEADHHDLVVAFAFARRVVALMFDRAAGAALVVVEDEVRVRAHLAGLVLDEHAGVQVEAAAVGDARVPAEADADGLEAGCLLAQADIAAFGK